MKDPRVLFGIVISIVATVLLFYVVNPWEVLAALRGANPLACVVLLVTVVLAMLIKAIRWRLFFPEPEKIRLWGLIEALFIGYMANTVLPLRAGELVRAFVAAETEKTSKSTTLATVLIEKVLDLGTMALLLLLLGLIFSDLPDSARYAAYVSGVGLAIAIGCIIFALAARRMATRLAEWFEERVPPLKSIGISGLLNAFLDGLAFARKPETMVWVIFWTLVQWTISAATVTLALVAVGINGSSPYELLQMTLLVLVATNLSMAIPSAPGYVGVFHGVFVATLALFAVREDTATAAAVVEHALVFGTFIVGGGYFLVRGEAGRAGGRRLGDLVSRARSTADEATEAVAMWQAIVWLLTVQALGLAVLPLTVRVFNGLPDRGYGLTRVVGLVVVGWLAYLTAMLGFTAYVGGTVAVLGVLAGVTFWVAWGRACLAALRARVRLIAAEEIVFLLIFGLAKFIRAYNADIAGQEKFMDYAFMHALLRTTSLPAEDMWLSGFAMPYYYLGYFLMGLPAKIAATPGPMAYSLAMVLVFATGFGAALTIVYGLVARARCASPAADAIPLAGSEEDLTAWAIGAGDRAVALGTRLDPASFGFGLLGGALTMVVGNLVGVFELIGARGWGSPAFWEAVGVKGLRPDLSPTWLPVEGGWWWRSSRVIPNIPPDGITEFPYFSFLLGDLHPHYIAIPFVLLIVALAASRWMDDESWPDLSSLLLAGVALATLIPASTWDVPAFWGLYLLGSVGDGWRRERSYQKLLSRLPALFLPFVLAFVLAVPYFVGYQSQQLGLETVKDRTPLVSMLILFGPALLVAALYATWLISRGDVFSDDARAGLGRLILVIGVLLVGLSLLGEAMFALLVAVLLALAAAGWYHLASPRYTSLVAPSALFCCLVALWAVCILVGTELIFLRDLFGSRMNTVFKFQYHAWLLLGIASASALGIIWRTRPAAPAWRGVALAVTALILIPGLAYPLGATWTKSNGFRGEPTLMGDRFLERGAQGDYRAIEWLRQTAQGRPVVVEAEGGDYSEHARVSTFSGLPTLIGWVGHELQWRGDQAEYGRRKQAVDAIYRATSREEIARIAEMYRIRYVFFGTLERTRYGAEAQGRLDRLLPVAYSRGGTTIYAVEPE